MIFPRWQPTLEFSYNPGKEKTKNKKTYLISLLLFTSSLLNFFSKPEKAALLVFLVLKWASSSWKVNTSDFTFWLKRSSLFVQFFSISGYLDQSHRSSERKHTHRWGIHVKEEHKVTVIWGLFVIPHTFSLFLLIHLILVIFKHNEMITFYYLKCIYNKKVCKWTKTYIPIRQIS